MLLQSSTDRLRAAQCHSNALCRPAFQHRHPSHLRPHRAHVLKQSVWRVPGAVGQQVEIADAQIADVQDSGSTPEAVDPTRVSVQDINAAQAEAEAAHQELLSGLLAAGADNETLKDIHEAYSTLQRLYHKAIRAIIQQHQQWAGSPAGEPVFMHPQPVDKPPGSTISASALQQLHHKAATAASAASLPLLHLAGVLAQLSDLHGPSLYVLPDLMTAITAGFGATDGPLLGRPAKQQQRARHHMAQLLLCSCMYPVHDQPIPAGAPHEPRLSVQDLSDIVNRCD